MIGFSGCLRGEEVFLTSLDAMLKFWEEKMLKKEPSQTMVMLKGGLKGKTWDKLRILPLVDVTDSVIGVRKRMGRWSDVLAK